MENLIIRKAIKLIQKQHGCLELPKSCAECYFKQKGGFFWECGYESDENCSIDIDSDGKPFDFRPEWCELNRLLGEDVKEENT